MTEVVVKNAFATNHAKDMNVHHELLAKLILLMEQQFHIGYKNLKLYFLISQIYSNISTKHISFSGLFVVSQSN